MATDLATVLAVFAVLADGDIVTESWYLGTESTGAPGGLNRHSTVECDGRSMSTLLHFHRLIIIK